MSKCHQEEKMCLPWFTSSYTSVLKHLSPLKLKSMFSRIDSIYSKSSGGAGVVVQQVKSPVGMSYIRVFIVKLTTGGTVH